MPSACQVTRLLRGFEREPYPLVAYTDGPVPRTFDADTCDSLGLPAVDRNRRYRRLPLPKVGPCHGSAPTHDRPQDCGRHECSTLGTIRQMARTPGCSPWCAASALTQPHTPCSMSAERVRMAP